MKCFIVSCWLRQTKRKNINIFNIFTGNAGTCRQITASASMRDTVWATQSCSLSFQTIGVWPENADGTDVNTVCRSYDNTLLASGDDWGRIKLFSYPTSQPKVHFLVSQ